jgi:hypothetical protein
LKAALIQVSDYRLLGASGLWVLWFPPPIKLTATEILLKVGLNTITLTHKLKTTLLVNINNGERK